MAAQHVRRISSYVAAVSPRSIYSAAGSAAREPAEQRSQQAVRAGPTVGQRVLDHRYQRVGERAQVQAIGQYAGSGQLCITAHSPQQIGFSAYRRALQLRAGKAPACKKQRSRGAGPACEHRPGAVRATTTMRGSARGPSAGMLSRWRLRCPSALPAR